jgi:hypothetical protein
MWPPPNLFRESEGVRTDPRPATPAVVTQRLARRRTADQRAQLGPLSFSRPFGVLSTRRPHRSPSGC